MNDTERLTERVQFLASPSLVREVDDLGFSRRLRTRGAALRLVIQKGLEAAKAEGQTEGGAGA